MFPLRSQLARPAELRVPGRVAIASNRSSLAVKTAKPLTPILCRVRRPLTALSNNASNACRDNSPALGSASSQRCNARRHNASGLPRKTRRSKGPGPACRGSNCCNHDSKASSSSSSNRRDRAAPANASLPAARTQAGVTRTRMRFRKKSGAALVRSSRQAAPLRRSAAFSSTFFRPSKGRK